MSEQEQEQGETQFEAPADVPETPAEGTEPEPEADESDEEEASAETPPDETPAEPEALSEKDVEKRLKAFEKEAVRHAGRVTDIAGDDSHMLVACPLCEPIIPGFIMAGTLTEDRREAVRVFMGDKKPHEWMQDSHRRRCEDCRGEGLVLTGSKVAGQETLPCTGCQGKGWVGEPAYATPPIASTPVATAETNGPPSVVPSAVDPPEVADLKRQGYVVIAPSAPVGA